MGRGSSRARDARRPSSKRALDEGSNSSAIPGLHTRDPLAAERAKVTEQAPRIASLGCWPDYIPALSLVERIPALDLPASGFDAGIACALNLIPADKQRLSAKLHAAYTPEAVEQVRLQAKEMDADSETCWWLAACSVCQEGRLSIQDFQEQLGIFKELIDNPRLRREVGIRELEGMRDRYEFQSQAPFDKIPLAVADGGLQGAYLDGHQAAVMQDTNEGLYFIGTYQPSLGLENFSWSSEIDDLRQPRSGPVHGSRQFVRCTDLDELQRALKAINLVEQKRLD